MISKNESELSIVVPVYNVDKWLEECLTSIQNQTFKNWECILIDDGSTDLSGKICDSYTKIDNRFKVIHQKNSGVSAARNAGIDIASAPLLSFIDPDDYISLNYFELLINSINSNNADIAFANTINISEDGEQNKEYFFVNFLNNLFCSKCEFVLKNKDEIIDYTAKGKTSLNSWGKLYKSFFWKDMRFPENINLGEETTVIPKICTNANSAVVVNQASYYYRIRKKSLLHGTVTKDRIKKTMLHSSIAYNELSSLFPEHKKDFARLKVSNDLCCLLNLSDNEKPNGSRLYMMQECDNNFISAIFEGFIRGDAQ